MARRRKDLPRNHGSTVDETVFAELLACTAAWIGPQLRKQYGRLQGHDVEDIIAVARLHAWQNREQFHAAKGEFQVWFARIARNAALDHFRAQTCHGELLVEPGRMTEIPDPHRKLRDQDVGPCTDWPNWQQVVRAIDLLPSAHRLVLLLDAASPAGKADDGWLAEELGISRSSVRVYRMRARAKARELIEQGKRLQGPC